MTNSDDIRSEIGGILRGKWTTREGQKVPEPTEIEFANTGVSLTGTVLYADLAESTSLVNSYNAWFAAEIYKCFLRGACRVIQANGGTVTAFDGDRIMAVYLGDSKNSSAVGTALELNHVVTRIINPLVKEVQPKIDLQVGHAVGIDTSALLVAKTGVRGSNDLVWVGRAANYAAKLATFRDGNYASWITTDVFDGMRDSEKYSKGGKGSTQMWEKRNWKARGIEVYCSNWMRSP